MNLMGINLAEANATALIQVKNRSKYHWIPDKPDSRDHIYELANITLPTKVDLRNDKMPPIVDQGNIGSCTANAIAGAIKYAIQKEGKTVGPLSRLFIYYQERVIENTVRFDAGAYIRDGIKAMYLYGAPLETTWPYIESKFATKPSTAAYTEAANRKLKTNTSNTVVNITGIVTGTNHINVSSTTGMVVGGALMISGTSIGSLVAGTYYVKTIGSNWVTVSTTYNGSTFIVPASASGTMTAQILPGYQSVPGGNPAAIKNALASGFPVVIGFTVYESFEYPTNNNTGMMPYPNTATEQVLGGHCVLVVGYDDTPGSPIEGRFICRNSWGTGWGDQGYFYMPYQVIQNRQMSSDFWIACTVNNP